MPDVNTGGRELFVKGCFSGVSVVLLVSVEKTINASAYQNIFGGTDWG